MGNILGKLEKGLRYLRHYGVHDFIIRLLEKREAKQASYSEWFTAHRATEEQLQRQKSIVCGWQETVKISIITPLYHTPERFLREMVASVQAQTYENWELCLADGSRDDSVQRVVEKMAEADSRLHYRRLSENLGIAGNTNQALAMATGDWIAFLDHDDLLEPDALFEAVRMIRQGAKAPGAERATGLRDGQDSEAYDMLYTDEDKVDMEGREHFDPHFKPDINIDLLRSNNYITHFLLVRKDLAERVGDIRAEYEGAQDHDFILRCVEQAACIGHIPRVLYHWRCHKSSTADNPLSKQYAVEAGTRAIAEHLKRLGVPAEVKAAKNMGFYSVSYPIKGTPLVSVLVFGGDKDKRDDRKKAGFPYPNLEFIRVCEAADVTRAQGEYLLFWDSALTPGNEECLAELLGSCQRTEVGIVGAKIIGANHRISHAGVVLGVGPEGVAANVLEGLPGAYSGYMHRASLQMDYSAVSGKCFMIKKSVYEKTGGMEPGLSPAFASVDLCLKVRELGCLVVYNPRAVFLEKNGKPQSGRKNRLTAGTGGAEKSSADAAYMKQRWRGILEQGDPYYNPNFAGDRASYKIKNP